MDVDHPEFDQDWDAAARSETQAERLDRNWSSLLQELRVTQTGVQLLTGFLLTLPFQARFAQLGDDLHTVYLMTVACSLAATVLLVAPVAMHRLLFRRHRLNTVVAVTHRCAYAGLLLLGTALSLLVVVPASVLLTAGPYALVRHPRYSTLMLGLFGVALVSNYLAIHLLAMLMLPLINLLARLEERELIKRFGDDYRRYAEQTPRFIPRPGRVDRA